jgi:hypothetical protein
MRVVWPSSFGGRDLRLRADKKEPRTQGTPGVSGLRGFGLPLTARVRSVRGSVDLVRFQIFHFKATALSNVVPEVATPSESKVGPVRVAMEAVTVDPLLCQAPPRGWV